MYSEIVNESGISQHTLEMVVIGGIGVFVLGLVFYLWWKQIVIGFGIIAAVYIFVSSPISDVKEVKTNEVVAVKHDVIEEKDDTPKEYIQDCMRFTGKNEFDCRVLWNEREDNASE